MAFANAAGPTLVVAVEELQLEGATIARVSEGPQAAAELVQL
jgi:hypothetical protein